MKAGIQTATERLNDRLRALLELRREAVQDHAPSWDALQRRFAPWPVDARLAQPGQSPFDRLASLDPIELDVLVLGYAMHTRPAVSRIVGALTERGPELDEYALVEVLGEQVLACVGPGSRLLREGWLEPLPGAASPLQRRFRLAWELLDSWSGQRPQAMGQDAVQWQEGEAVHTPSVAVDGPGWGLVDLQEHLAGAAVAFSRITDAAHAPRLLRMACLAGTVAVVDLRALSDELPVARSLHALGKTLGVPTLTWTRASLNGAVPRHPVRVPEYPERLLAWKEAAHRRGRELTEQDAEALASGLRVSAGFVDRVMRTAAPQEGLLDVARRLRDDRVPHARRVLLRRSFEDVVLHPETRDALARLIHFLQHRARLTHEQGLGRSYRLERGPLVLFSGRSGTGKTLSAEVVAGELGRPLHVVDLSQLVSKYIGETEKHIDEVLSSAERAGSVLFFDEGDALFSQRTDVESSNDRNANLEVGYLLQRIEEHHGLVILATNLRSSIDEAFLRRFHARIEFPLPGPRERGEIWRLMLPPGVPCSEDLDLQGLAERHRLSGGDIRNAALKAIFLAAQEQAPLGAGHLERAVGLELLELGRLSRRREAPGQDRGTLLQGLSQGLERELEEQLRRVFLKEVQVLHGAPTKEALAGKKPAVSLALYQMARTRQGGMRAGFVLSAWSTRAEEETLLLGTLQDALDGLELPELQGHRVRVRVLDSFDFDLLHRFWSSHGHPVRAALVLEAELEPVRG